MSVSWLAWGPEERSDAERVATLEEAAENAEPIRAARLLSEADALRAKWNRPRSGERFASVAELVEELQSIARDARGVDKTDPDALEAPGGRASMVGSELELFAGHLDEAHGRDR